MNARISPDCVRILRSTILLAAVSVLVGCNRDAGEPWPLDFPPSERLELSLRASYDRISDQSSGDPTVVADLETYDSLKQGLYSARTRAAATQRLHELWSNTPDHVLWPNLARTRYKLLTDVDLVYSTFDSPVCADSSTAIGAYMRAWQQRKFDRLASNFELARERSAELSAFPRIWIELKCAYGARITGSPDESVRRALGLLPEARDLGGARLESFVWSEIGWANFNLGELDDALHAAAIADTLATLAVPEGGAIAGVLEIRRLRADILSARRDTRAALALYRSNIEQAVNTGLEFLASRYLNHAGTVTEAIGDPDLTLELDRRGLAFALSDQDSVAIPRHMMNIASNFRLMGELDSCLVYQSRVERWIAAHPDEQNVALLPQFQAEYYSQIGAYEVVDSLLSAAADLSEADDSIEARAELYIELIRGWMQVGRPDLVYQLIGEASEFRSGFGDIHADRNVTADLNLLIGEFYTRRGQFALADESLDFAATALESRPDPEKKWALARNRGLLDRARDNFRGAEKWFQECVRIGEELGYPDLSATGRLLVGSVRLEMNDFAGARVIFPSNELKSSLATQILALRLTGVSHLREGNPEVALRFLIEAHEICRSWTPLDLIGRVELEIGRAHASMGDPDTALKHYEQVASRILDADYQTDTSEELAYFTGDLRRELVEARLAIEPVAAQASLDFAMDLLPRWKPVDGALRSPQVIYFEGDELSGRWVVDESGASWARLPGSDAIIAQLARVLADLSAPGRSISTVALAALSETLLHDLEWPAGETLHIVPDLQLFGVPWAALTLPSTGQGIVEHSAVMVLDRPTDGGDIHARSTGDRLLVIATNSSGSSGLDRLRNAETEANEVSAVWPAGKADLQVGSSAAGSLASGADLSPYRAIHVASHAMVYSGRADRTTLVLEDESENPPTVSNIRDLDIPADLVFLSACEAGEGGETRSVHAGLARSFQDAGARQVVAPISVIDDEAARDLAVSFYKHWESGASVAKALRAAQLEQIRAGGERSHPFYWAFYQVFGAE